MLDNELPPREGLPPRDRNAVTPEHANSSTLWLVGAIAVFAVLVLLAFGRPNWNANTASNPDTNMAPGMTTGAAPKDTR